MDVEMDQREEEEVQSISSIDQIPDSNISMSAFLHTDRFKEQFLPRTDGLMQDILPWNIVSAARISLCQEVRRIMRLSYNNSL